MGVCVCEIEDEMSQVPNDAVSAFTDRHNRRFILSRDFEDVTEDIVLYETAAVAKSRWNILDPGGLRRRSCVGHDGVGGLS